MSGGRRLRARGFTFLELMLVMLIIGVIASLAMPSLPSRDDARVLERSTRTLLAILQLQEEEALLTGGVRGIRFLDNIDAEPARYHYQWLVWSSFTELWQAADGKVAQLDGALRGAGDLRLQVEGRDVKLALNAERNDPGALLTPQIVLYPSGEVTDFELTLSSEAGGEEITITGGYEGVRLRESDNDTQSD